MNKSECLNIFPSKLVFVWYGFEVLGTQLIILCLFMVIDPNWRILEFDLILCKNKTQRSSLNRNSLLSAKRKGEGEIDSLTCCFTISLTTQVWRIKCAFVSPFPYQDIWILKSNLVETFKEAKIYSIWTWHGHSLESLDVMLQSSRASGNLFPLRINLFYRLSVTADYKCRPKYSSNILGV